MKSIFFLLVFILAANFMSEARAGEGFLKDSNSDISDCIIEEKDSLPFDFPELKPLIFPKRIFKITDYGAVPDDTTYNNSIPINKAIEACSLSGGGVVIIPSGIWRTGAIHLKSNVNLHVSKGAELKFSQRFHDYLPNVLMQRGGIMCYNYSPFIYAYKAKNIAVTGEGLLDGQGTVWWAWKNRQPGMKRLFEMGKNGTPVSDRVFGREEDGVRPPFIQFLECRDILLEDITLKDGPSWNIHPVFCENMIIRKVKIISHGPNNDGVDIDGCRNVLIEECFTDVGDDNFCIKSGRDEEAWRMGKICENVIIQNCISKAGHGGFTIGSEMSAGVKNILVRNCKFLGTNNGINMKSRIGRGGTVENIWINNIDMKGIKNQAIVIDLKYDGEPIEREMNYQNENKDRKRYSPVFRNIQIEKINSSGSRAAIVLRGLSGKCLYDIQFKDVFIESESGLESSFVNQISFDNTRLIQPRTN